MQKLADGLLFKRRKIFSITKINEIMTVKFTAYFAKLNLIPRLHWGWGVGTENSGTLLIC